jgi:hypothetical protein
MRMFRTVMNVHKQLRSDVQGPDKAEPNQSLHNAVTLTQSTYFFNAGTNLRIIFWSAVSVSSTLKIRQLSINFYDGKDKIKSIYKMNDDEI